MAISTPEKRVITIIVDQQPGSQQTGGGPSLEARRVVLNEDTWRDTQETKAAFEEALKARGQPFLTGTKQEDRR